MNDKMEGEGFQRRVASGYEKLAESDTLKGVVLDGSKSQKDIADEVWRNLLNRSPHFPSTKNHGCLQT